MLMINDTLSVFSVKQKNISYYYGDYQEKMTSVNACFTERQCPVMPCLSETKFPVISVMLCFTEAFIIAIRYNSYKF